MFFRGGGGGCSDSSVRMYANRLRCGLSAQSFEWFAVGSFHRERSNERRVDYVELQ